MTPPHFAILLHTHIPYVRRNGDWPVGEEWLLEAWAESYLSIWMLLEDMVEGKAAGKLALTMTPVLADQLQDSYLEERLDWYLRNKIRQAESEIGRLDMMGDGPRKLLASRLLELYRGRLRAFENRFRGRMMEVLKRGMEAGCVEVLCSAATHGHLPSLGSDRARHGQLGVGLDSYRRIFDREPAGLWLPECSYSPDLDRVLSGFSPPLEYVILDYSAPADAGSEVSTWQPCRLGSTPLFVFMRDEVAHELVWTMEGYPSHGAYRDYAKRDHDGHGTQYWRITSIETPLDEKDIYEPDAAVEQASRDARDFVDRLRLRRREIGARQSGGFNPTLILAAYDTELLGHWWLEGPQWLREVLSLLGEETLLPRDISGESALEAAPVIAPSCTAWCSEGDFSTWVNTSTADIWERTHDAEEEFFRLMEEAGDDEGSRRALLQAARELLLLESSDWTFMVTRDKAAAYARERFYAHRKRFDTLASMLRNKVFDETALNSLEETDNLFARLDLGSWRR